MSEVHDEGYMMDEASFRPAEVEPRTRNRQLYDNSELRKDGADYYSSPDALYNDKPPNFAILRERPEHRLIVWLKVCGHSNQEIAKATNLSYNWVCQIVRQPWFRERFIELAKNEGKDATQQFLQSEVMPSLEVLREVRDNPKNLSSTRVTAANALLDRFLGKPTQHIKSESTLNVNRAAEEVSEVQRELAAIDAQLKARGVTIPSASGN